MQYPAYKGRILQEAQELKMKKCIWRKTLEDNLKGIGTIFNKDKKNKNLARLGCYECDGYDDKCEYYNNGDHKKYQNKVIIDYLLTKGGKW